MMTMSSAIKLQRQDSNYVNTEQLADMEQELIEIQEKYGIHVKRNQLFSFIDKRVAAMTPKTVSKSRYIKLLLSCGWLCGAHRFYAGKKITGFLYLLFCWTGIPFAMCMIDLMQVLPIKTNESNCITL